MNSVIKKECVRVLTGLIILISVFSLSGSVFAASLHFQPSSGSYEVGDTIEVSVLVTSAENSVNAYSGTVSFSERNMEAISLSTSGSVVDFWVQDPGFSNDSGKFYFDGVTFNPGFQGVGEEVITMVFEAKAAGTASLKFNDAAVLAHDGAGTNILESVSTATFSVGEVTSKPIPDPTPDPVPDTPDPYEEVGTPQISSPTHPDPDSWYDDNSPRFVWEVPAGVTAVRLIMDKDVDLEPFVVYDPPIEEKELKDIDDGVWYFKAQFRDREGWGEVEVFKVNIDTSAPEEFSIEKVDMEGLVKTRAAFEFKATDSVSGISHFEIWIDDERRDDWADDGTGVYTTPSLSSGEHEIRVLAYNRSGKSIERTKVFNIKKSREGIAFQVGKISISYIAVIWSLSILLLLSLSALIYIWYRGRNKKTKRSKK